MKWKKIEITDRAIFDNFLSIKPIELSDYTFTNFFIWNHHKNLTFAITENHLCVKEEIDGQAPLLLMPIGEGDTSSVIQKLQNDCSEKNEPFQMRAISEEVKTEIESKLPNQYKITPEPDRFDYVYNTSDLINLAGSKYKTKRNHLNIFKETYEFSYHPLTPDLLDEVIESENEWCKKRDCESEENLEAEKTGILKATTNFEKLNFEGAILKIHNKTIAFTFGEMLTPTTVVIHIEKADPDIRGAYQMINQQFLENRWPNSKFVNREEDLGIDGLKKAKMSYNPIKMIKKYKLEPRK